MKPSLIIAGLGNPGKQYEKTRHNAGFQAVDLLAENFVAGQWKDKPKFAAKIMEARVVTFPVLLVKPQTYMNASGSAIKKVIDFYRLDPVRQLIVISDDIDLPLGEIRMRAKGGPGTHNGLKSVVDIFGEDFHRLRIGLGNRPENSDLANWVLSSLTKTETDTLQKSYGLLPEMIKSYLLVD